MLKSMPFIFSMFLSLQTLHANPQIKTEDLFTKKSVNSVIEYANTIVKNKSISDHEKIERLYTFHQWIMSHYPLYTTESSLNENTSSDMFLHLLLWKAVGQRVGEGYWFLIEDQLGDSFREDANEMVGEDFRQSLYPQNIYWLARQEIQKEIFTNLRNSIRSYALKLRLQNLFSKGQFSRELKLYYAYCLVQYIGFTVLKENEDFYKNSMQSIVKKYDLNYFDFPAMKEILENQLEISRVINSSFDKLQETQVRVLLNLISGS